MHLGCNLARFMASKFVISLDFELFWGVSESRTIDGYGQNIEGEWSAVPAILDLFRRYQIKATWATVGMLMCRDYAQWRDIRPTAMPGYFRTQCSTYALDSAVREIPKMFFARPLVEQILATPGQELGGHSYSHFYCTEAGATPEQFAADLVCAREVALDLGISFRSFVFPRNQVQADCLAELAKAGYKVYRGNPQHWLYSAGHHVSGGAAGRGVRLADAYVPISGSNTSRPSLVGGVVNCPASFFLRPWSRRFASLESLRLQRLKRAMLAAAQAGETFHLWWHPHNFGVHTGQNLAVLQSLLQYHAQLRDDYGMQSITMGDLAADVAL